MTEEFLIRVADGMNSHKCKIHLEILNNYCEEFKLILAKRYVIALAAEEKLISSDEQYDKWRDSLLRERAIAD